jgi:phosphate:Na+ symporter
MTVLTQSSSAAIAIVLAAASGGAVPLDVAAAMVIGANVGTTSTAAFAVIGATANAKRLASAHILFNVLTAAIALAFLPGLIWAIENSSQTLGIADHPALVLALFHTLFNLVGVAVMWPMTPRLSDFLKTKFRSKEELKGEPHYLDKSLIETPTLAYRAACLELNHAAEITRNLSISIVSTEEADGINLQRELHVIHDLTHRIDKYAADLSQTSLPSQISSELPKILRSTQYLINVGELADFISQVQQKIRSLENEELTELCNQFHAELVALLTLSNIESVSFSMHELDQRLQRFDQHYHELKDRLLAAGARQHVRIRDMSFTNEQHSSMHRMAEQMVKATRMMHYLQSNLPHDGEKREVDLDEVNITS